MDGPPSSMARPADGVTIERKRRRDSRSSAGLAIVPTVARRCACSPAVDARCSAESSHRRAAPRSRRWRRARARDRSARRRSRAGPRPWPSAAPAPRLRLQRLRCSNSSNSRAFSMAMTAWSANVSSSAISRSVNGRPRDACDDEDADRVSPSQERACTRPCVRTPIALVVTSLGILGRADSAAGRATCDRSALQDARPATRLRRDRSPTLRATSRRRPRMPRPRCARHREPTAVRPSVALNDRVLGARRARRRLERWHRRPSRRSVGDDAMTRSTSAVAVCCSSASCGLGAARRLPLARAAQRSPPQAARSSRRRPPSRLPLAAPSSPCCATAPG